MSVYNMELYSKDLQERVEELEEAMEKALACNEIESIKRILEEVN
jgi:hypothetical protein